MENHLCYTSCPARIKLSWKEKPSQKIAQQQLANMPAHRQALHVGSKLKEPIKMRKKITVLLAVIVWFSVIAQFVLMVQNRTASIFETIIRFFSFFTILTNTLVAIYFTVQSLKGRKYNKSGTLTAIAVYITIVGIVYQVLLRHVWQPTGMQLIVDELLHTINPLLVILFWYFYEEKAEVKYGQIKSWLLYPLVYLIYVLIRGSLSGFYPYPFINVAEIGFGKTLLNSLLLLLFFILVASFFIVIGKKTAKKSLLPT